MPPSSPRRHAIRIAKAMKHGNQGVGGDVVQALRKPGAPGSGQACTEGAAGGAIHAEACKTIGPRQAVPSQRWENPKRLPAGRAPKCVVPEKYAQAGGVPRDRRGTCARRQKGDSMSGTAAKAALVLVASLCHANAALAQDASEAALGTDPPVMYTTTWIDPPAGYRRLFLQAVNNIGDAAGVATKLYHPKYYIVLRTADGTFHFISRPPGCIKRYGFHVLRLNDQYQMLLTGCGGAEGWFWGPRSKWTPIQIPGYDLTVENMNDYGDVVGTAEKGDQKFGFIWKQSSGAYQLFNGDGGYGFGAINDQRKIAGDIIHDPNPKKPFDRSGVSAAMFRQNPTPILTWDGNIQDRQEYKDPAHWDYHVNSHAVAINEGGTIALNSPKSFDNLATMGCRWHWKEGHMRCFGGAGRRSIAVAVDDQDDVFIRTQNKQPSSYVMVPDGTVYELGQVTDPPVGDRVFDVQGASASGIVVGNTDGKRSRDSFILTPQGQGSRQAATGSNDRVSADLLR
jgi:hypothetical protein